MLVSVEPNDILKSPPAALVNPTLKVFSAYAEDPIATLLASCAEPVHPVVVAIPTAFAVEKSHAPPETLTTE